MIKKTSSPNQLFVYGTLLLDVPSPMSQFLRRSVQVKQSTSLPGQLYDLGSYPGFIYDAHSKMSVQGELLSIDNLAEVLPVLDRYEGIHNHPSEYERTLVPIDNSWCWTYQFVGKIEGLAVIKGGDYRSYYQLKEQHLQFIRGND